MPDRASLEEVERVVSQLPPAERLKLVAHVCEQLAAAGDGGAAEQPGLAQVDAWLAECEALRTRVRGTVDAAEEIRRIRQERAGER